MILALTLSLSEHIAHQEEKTKGGNHMEGTKQRILKCCIPLIQQKFANNDRLYSIHE